MVADEIGWRNGKNAKKKGMDDGSLRMENFGKGKEERVFLKLGEKKLLGEKKEKTFASSGNDKRKGFLKNIKMLQNIYIRIISKTEKAHKSTLYKILKMSRRPHR